MTTQEYNNLNGYTKYSENEFNSKNVFEMKTILGENILPNKQIVYETSDAEILNLKKYVKTSFTSLLPGLDKTVPYISEREFMNFYNYVINHDMYLNDVLFEINNLITKKNMFEIDTKYSNSFNSSKIVTPYIYCANIEYLSKFPLFVEYTTISKKNSSSSIGVYSRQCVNMLLLKNKIIVNDYYAKEVLGIFFEKLMQDKQGFNPDITTLNNLITIKEYGLDTITNDEQNNVKMLLKSSVLAEELFVIYKTNDDFGKKVLLEDIKKVLSAQKTLKFLLNKYNISFASESGLETFNYMMEKSKELIRK